MGHRFCGWAIRVALSEISLLCFVLFEELAGFFQVEDVAVYGELVDAGVFGDGDDMLDRMAVLAERVDDEIDVYVVHACQSTAAV
jgi:hypothetical protein